MLSKYQNLHKKARKFTKKMLFWKLQWDN